VRGAFEEENTEDIETMDDLGDKEEEARASWASDELAIEWRMPRPGVRGMFPLPFALPLALEETFALVLDLTRTRAPETLPD
jgi:hypothetical protein